MLDSHNFSALVILYALSRLEYHELYMKFDVIKTEKCMN